MICLLGEMEAGPSFSLDIFINQLAKSGFSKAGEVAAVDDGYGEIAQALHGFDVGVDVGMIGIVDQGAVVDNIAGEENSSGFFEEADAAGRVSGCMNSFEVAITEIDDVIVFKLALGGRRLDFVAGRAPALGLAIEHFLGCVAIRKGEMVFGIGENFCLCTVHTAVGKFVVAADVIEVGVAGDAGEFSLGDKFHMGRETEVAEARVEEKIAIMTAGMPHVAAEEGFDPGLVDKRYIIAHADCFIPVAGLNLHGSTFQVDHVFGTA